MESGTLIDEWTGPFNTKSASRVAMMVEHVIRHNPYTVVTFFHQTDRVLISNGLTAKITEHGGHVRCQTNPHVCISWEDNDGIWVLDVAQPNASQNSVSWDKTANTVVIRWWQNGIGVRTMAVIGATNTNLRMQDHDDH